MLLQYMIFAIWWVPLAAYLTKMDVSSNHKALILSSMGIGCLVSPFMGMLADRYFKGQFVLAVCNIVTGALLILSGITSNPFWLFIYLMVAMIFYMPTWSLTSSIAMTHLPTNVFARVRMFGSVGWVLSGIFSLVFVTFLDLGFDGTKYPFFVAAFIAIITGLYNLTLPDCQPTTNERPKSFLSLLGLRTVSLMKEPNFFWFIILSFLSMIPFSMYWSFGSEFLLDKGFEYISITMNFGQLFEMLFLLSVPFVVKKYGLRTTMIFGLVALLIRYVAFWGGSTLGTDFFYMLGIIVHGLIFGYFYVGGQMFIDLNSPKHLKSESQGFIFLITFGAGLIVGNFINSKLISIFSTTAASGLQYDWSMIWGITTFFSVLLLILFSLLVRKREKARSVRTKLAGVFSDT